jgi:hypothetical protein
MWALLYAIHLQGHWWVAYDHDGFNVAGGPYKSREDAFIGMATLRGQVVDEVELR